MEYTKYGSRLLFFLVFFVLLHQPAHAQNSDESEHGSWLVLCGTAKIHEDWSIPAVGIVRHHHMLDKYGFFFFRTGASYRISNASSVTGGFALLNSNSYLESNDVVNTNQLWFYAEYTLRSKLSLNRIAQRFRLENRRLVNTEDPKVNNRIRYRFQFIRPIYNDIYIKAFDEILLNLKGDAFSQNRFFIGIGRQLTSNLNVDIGYLNRKFKNSDENMIRLGLTFNIDLTENDMALNTE